MKLGSLLIILVAFLVGNQCKVLIKSNKATEKSKVKKNKLITISEAYNVEGMAPSIAITTADVHLPNVTDEYDDYKNPQMVNKLMEEVKRPIPGPLEPIGEVPTIHDYYDGSMNLNVVKIDCKIYTSKSDCVNQSMCGWCGSNGGCVLGGSAGPDSPCVKSTQIYANPIPNFQPIVRKINENVGGVTQTTISSNS